MMSEMQARLKSEHTLRYPRLSPQLWYEVSPIFPGVTTRRVDIFGRRITRIRTQRDYETVQAAHFEFRPSPAEEHETVSA
jgi:hypothetical protein